MKPVQKPSVFDFLDAAQFLKSHFDWRKSLDPKFSLAGWSNEIGNSNKVTLRFILKKQRSISERSAQVLKSNMKMSEDEGRCFDSLIAYSQAKTTAQRQAFGQQLLKFHKNQISQKELLPVSAAKHAFGPIILTLLTFHDFKKDTETIARFLMIKISEAEKVLTDLETDGLVILNSDQTYSLTFTENKFRIPDSESLKKYYEYWMESAKAALELPKDVRSYRSLKFALSPQEYTDAIEKLNEYAIGLLSKFQSNEFSGRRLYMFESALFPISIAADKAEELALDLSN